MKMTSSNVLLNSLYKYYNEKGNMNKLIEIIEDNNNVSLRIIDWFVTNYSKKHNVYYTIYQTDNKANTFVQDGNKLLKVFNTYHAYKSQLKSYSKKRFDPFCRWERINIPYGENTYIQTTIGQLNFFRWVLDNKLLDYIEKHFDEINADMNKRNSTAKNRKEKVNKTRKTREELSVSASKSIKKENVEITVSFK